VKRGKQPSYNGREHNPLAKLSEKDVAEIRKRRGKRGFIVAMADEFGVSHSAISLIRSGKTWRNVA
jgi:hypothetical protein